MTEFDINVFQRLVEGAINENFIEDFLTEDELDTLLDDLYTNINLDAPIKTDDMPRYIDDLLVKPALSKIEQEEEETFELSDVITRVEKHVEALDHLKDVVRKYDLLGGEEFKYPLELYVSNLVLQDKGETFVITYDIDTDLFMAKPKNSNVWAPITKDNLELFLTQIYL